MMQNTEWNDEQLEKLLKQLPSVKDNRTRNEIYQKLMSNTTCCFFYAILHSTNDERIITGERI
jgi:hypothetical protein